MHVDRMATLRSRQRINELSGSVGQGNRHVPGAQQLPWPTAAYGVLLTESRCALNGRVGNTVSSAYLAVYEPPDQPRKFRGWSVCTRRDESSCSNRRPLAGLPTAQASQGFAAKPARHYPAQRGNDARLRATNANGWCSVFSMTGG